MLDPLLIHEYTPRQRELLELTERLAEQLAPYVAEYDREAAFPHASIATLVNARYHALSVPVAFGGLGASLLECVLAQERLARSDAASALVINMPIHLLGAASEADAWPPHQLARICSLIAEQGALINSAASEPELGSPTRGGAFSTAARREEGGWRLSGRKTFVSGLPGLTHILVTARIDDGTAVFLVRSDLPGVRIEETWDSLGMRATASHDLVLDDVQLAADDLIVERGEGGRSASSSAWFWLTIAAIYLGIAAAARDAAVTYANERHPTNLGGQPIAATEGIQRRLGEIEMHILPARALLYSVAQSWVTATAEQRLALLPALGATKAAATSAATSASDLAQQVAGGAGMRRDLPFERLLRDSRAGLFHPPSYDSALLNLGRALVAEQH